MPVASVNDILNYFKPKQPYSKPHTVLKTLDPVEIDIMNGIRPSQTPQEEKDLLLVNSPAIK